MNEKQARRLELQVKWHESDLRRAVRRLSKGVPGAQAEVNEAKARLREIRQLLARGDS